MPTIEELRSYGKEIDDLLRLDSFTVAVKMIRDMEEIPAEAVRPKRDHNEHIAQCQAFSLTRRDGKTVAMLKEDHWCYAPVIGYGLVEQPDFFKKGGLYNPQFDDDPEIREALGGTGSKFLGHFLEKPELAKNMTFPCLEAGKYIGCLTAPLRDTTFEPDVVFIYSNNAQLRNILMAIKYKEGVHVTSEFDPIDSCIYSLVPLMEGKQDYVITIPDPGEQERALTDENKIIFSLTRDKLKVLVEGLRHYDEIKLGYVHLTKLMQADFEQPQFYTLLFKRWGIIE
ncbi:MAG: DUF169 domain-containing protein [Actinobacteria bacterium]|jgi:uncharacterized protein (DUF169 family)|nr:DUF169 domain-containing protein [Actinomycetota bacterium]